MTRTHIAAAAFLGAIAVTASAQTTARVAVAPESKLWFEGTSNLHGWSCTAEKFDAVIELDAAAVAELATATPKVLKRVEVKVPVKALKCGHGGMDDNLYKALKADDTPEISYILATFDAAPGEAEGFTLKTNGTLAIAGKENKLTMNIVATRLPDGTVKATGVVPIKMTDFGIKPPTAMFGTLRTGDEVKVNFALTIGPERSRPRSTTRSRTTNSRTGSRPAAASLGRERDAARTDAFLFVRVGDSPSKVRFLPDRAPRRSAQDSGKPHADTEPTNVQ
jgi:polyisoprenoid-binding protein YceI